MLGTAPPLLKAAAAIAALAVGHGLTSSGEPNATTRQPASRGVRLAAAPPAFVFAALIAVLPTVATVDFGVAGGPMRLEALLMVPLLAIFTVVFSGPFALPVLLVLAWRNARGVGLQVLWGLLATLPAMAFFAVAVPGQLTWSVAGAIVLGGALGGLAASAARDGVETFLSALPSLGARASVRLAALCARWAGRAAAREDAMLPNAARPARAIAAVPTRGETL